MIVNYKYICILFNLHRKNMYTQFFFLNFIKQRNNEIYLFKPKNVTILINVMMSIFIVH